MGEIKFLTAMGLFIGQSKEFFELVTDLAENADERVVRGPFAETAPRLENSPFKSGCLLIGQCLNDILLHCFPPGEDGPQQRSYNRNA